MHFSDLSTILDFKFKNVTTELLFDLQKGISQKFYIIFAEYKIFGKSFNFSKCQIFVILL